MNRRLIALILFLATGCSSMRTIAVNQVANAIANGGTTFSADDDPELVGAAIPFSLKLMESLLAQSPNNVALLTATAKAFTQYSYGWVDTTDAALTDDPARNERAKRLYLRGRDYGLRALELSIDNFRVRLAADPTAAMRLARKRDVEALYWTATAWGLAIGGSKDDLQLLGDLPTVEALIARAAELDPDYDDGALHTFLMTYEASRSGISKDSETRARAHFEDAVRVSGGTSASVFVAAAEALSIPEQNRAEFDALIARALAVDLSAKPASRLQNILAQRRARFLLAHAGDYFLEEPATKGQQ